MLFTIWYACVLTTCISVVLGCAAANSRYAPEWLYWVCMIIAIVTIAASVVIPLVGF